MPRDQLLQKSCLYRPKQKTANQNTVKSLCD